MGVLQLNFLNLFADGAEREPDAELLAFLFPNTDPFDLRTEEGVLLDTKAS